ncbi:MAG: hypothetical protein SGI77_01505 [Pirellulaceae bacterium]|nr:hypothetical protein [Pirellulaceae bacterium]
MPNDDFWSVELGHGMGPLVLGLPRSQIYQILEALKYDVDLEADMQEDLGDDDPGLYLDDIETTFSFTRHSPYALSRMDIDDRRLRFGPMQVHGKPVHQIVELLKIPPAETLWCDFYEDEEQAKAGQRTEKPKSDTDLLMFGTLWITSLGLGLSLGRGEIETVHLCDPERSPRIGTGQWTVEQRRLSEAGMANESKVAPVKPNPLSRLLLVCMTIAMGALVWRAIDLQSQWNNVPDVAATVISTNPPPPEPFPTEYVLGYVDSSGGEHEIAVRSLDIYGLPAMGAEVNVRFLPDAPDKPLTHSKHRDVGFDLAMPYGIAIFAIYWSLNLVIAFLPNKQKKSVFLPKSA